RGPVLAFLPYCSLPELESCIVTWDFFETIHSRSYTYIMKNVYSNPTEVLDSILDNKAIVARAKSVTQHYDNFIDFAETNTITKETEFEFKKKFYLALLSVNILEGIRFYVSFACTFAFGELKLMEGSAKILSLIARDESQHLAITQTILNNYRKHKDDKVMSSVMKECEKDAYKMYEDAVVEEKDWVKYLFQNGSMVGLSENLLNLYVEYMTNKRMRAIGLDPIYEVGLYSNPLPWTQHWLSSKGLQNAPQETEIESYIVGAIKQDVNDSTFDDFKL
ncbi:uncharacterized protein METZ01_LOCUS347854, partial [marine metagenome]